MTSIALKIVPVTWLLWVAFWLFSARGTKVTQWKEPYKSQLIHRLPLAVGCVLLFVREGWPSWLQQRFIPDDSFGAILGAVIVILSLGFTVWARLDLGRNWSAEVTLKEDHSLIRSGPYKLVRHPIYTGVFFAFCGTALVAGELRGAVAAALCLAAFIYKSKLEEKKLMEIFPEYVEYRKETKALIPFIY
jgi:protein-S-isoprenylcysteine O-methyltransferase Ste14